MEKKTDLLVQKQIRTSKVAKTQPDEKTKLFLQGYETVTDYIDTSFSILY